MTDRFERTALLLGDEALNTLAGKRVCLFGCGGVGGFAAEALIRSGLGALELVDDDIVCLSNINRQIIATENTLGRKKTTVLKERLNSINPKAEIVEHKCFFLPENAASFDFSQYDYVIDAVNTVTAKISIIIACHKAGTPVISCMGAGNKLDPSQFKIGDIYETSMDPLSRVMRRELKSRGIPRLKVLYSTEPPVIKKRTPGSVAWVPSVAGLMIGGEVVKELTK